LEKFLETLHPKTSPSPNSPSSSSSSSQDIVSHLTGGVLSLLVFTQQALTKNSNKKKKKIKRLEVVMTRIVETNLTIRTDARRNF